MQALEYRPSEGVSSSPRPIRRAIVLYGSRFGNTERVAMALARGLRTIPDVEVECRSIDLVRASELARYDLLAIGGPTEMFSASAAMKAFLAELPSSLVRGKRGFAFETRLASRLSGSAARYIEKRLVQVGVDLVQPSASATVRGMTKEERAAHGDEGAPDWVRKLDKSGRSAPSTTAPRLDLLTPGAEAAFERIGVELGRAISVPT